MDAQGKFVLMAIEARASVQSLKEEMGKIKKCQIDFDNLLASQQEELENLISEQKKMNELMTKFVQNYEAKMEANLREMKAFVVAEINAAVKKAEKHVHFELRTAPNKELKGTNKSGTPNKFEPIARRTRSLRR